MKVKGCRSHPALDDREVVPVNEDNRFSTRYMQFDVPGTFFDGSEIIWKYREVHFARL